MTQELVTILNSKGINALSLTQNADYLIEKFEDDSTTDDDKIRIGDYFCRRVYGCLYRKSVFDLIKASMGSLILNGTHINLILRLSFLRWLEETVVYELAKYQYENEIDIEKISYLQILKVLVRSNNITANLKLEIKNHILTMFDETTDRYLKNNIAELISFLDSR